MQLFRWIRPRRSRKASPQIATRRFIPAVECLEDRTVPSGFGDLGAFGALLPAASPATHFEVVVPRNVQPGTIAYGAVVALDAANHPACTYTGTVNLTSNDGAATLPSEITFNKGNLGFHFFKVTFGTAGSETVTATDATTSITGSGTSNTTATKVAAVADHFLVVAPENSPVGQNARVSVLVLDASNHLVPTYTGTVHLSSSTDNAASFPPDYQFMTTDYGHHTFKVTFGTLGKQNVTATDTASITGSAVTNVAQPGVATHLAIIGLPFAFSGRSTTVVVVALDAFNHVATSYTGTVHLSTSDFGSGASLPQDYQFTSNDGGKHAFKVTLVTQGKQMITAEDSVNSLSQTLTIHVLAAPNFGPWLSGVINFLTGLFHT